MNTLRLREDQEFDQDATAGKRQSQDLHQLSILSDAHSSFSSPTHLFMEIHLGYRI